MEVRWGNRVAILEWFGGYGMGWRWGEDGVGLQDMLVGRGSGDATVMVRRGWAGWADSGATRHENKITV